MHPGLHFSLRWNRTTKLRQKGKQDLEVVVLLNLREGHPKLVCTLVHVKVGSGFM